MSRIFWTEEEKDRIIERVFSMRQNDPESSLTAIVNRAMSQLPEDRRRQVPSVKVIPWLPEAIKQRFAEQRKLVRTHEQVRNEAAVAEQKHSDLRNQLREALDKARREALSKAPLADLLTALVEKLKERDTGELNRLKERVERLERGAAKSPTAPAPEPTPEAKLPSVLIVGMLPNQNRELLTHFGKGVKLVFLDKDNESAAIPNADAAVVNAKFISHTLQARVQREYHGRGKVFLVKGGLSSVKERVETALKELGWQSTK